MFDDEDNVFFLNEDENDSSIENFIYQEVVNRKEKERRSKIKADYIKKNGNRSGDDEIKSTPSDRSSYKKAYIQNIKDVISGKRKVGTPNEVGYSRLYGAGGKRNFLANSLRERSTKMKSTPVRNPGVFKGRNWIDANISSNRRGETANHVTRNKVYLSDREAAKKVPHKKIIDKVATGARAIDRQKTVGMLSPLLFSKSKTAQQIAASHPTVRKALNHAQNELYFGSKVANMKDNQDSLAVKTAYKADELLSKGAKKAKNVAKKFVANKLKHNRSAKSENTDLLDFDDWDID